MSYNQLNYTRRAREFTDMALYNSAASESRADTELTEWYSQPSDGGLRIARDKYVFFSLIPNYNTMMARDD